MRKGLVFLFLILISLASLALGIFTGGTPISPERILDALVHPSSDGIVNTLVWHFRIPRLAMAFIIGAALAQCGVIFQAILRNPLAEPYTLGVSGGGALGATVAIILDITGLPMVLICFAGCCLSIFFVLGVASLKHFTNSMLILAGVILSFLLSSVVMFIFAVATSRDVHASIMWLMGSLSAPQSSSIRIMVFMVLPIMLILCGFAKDLNLLSLGDEKTYHLGLDAKKAKTALLILASLITGACVSVSGIIGFIGLIIPHIMRRLTGADHHFLLPSSMIAGGSFLVLSDTVSQLLLRPLELPVGVITGMIGGAFFIIYLLRARAMEVM